MTPHDPGTRVPVLSHKIPKTVRSAPVRSSSSSSPSSLPLTAHLLYAMQYLKHVLVCSNTPHEAIIPVSWEINGSGEPELCCRPQRHCGARLCRLEPYAHSRGRVTREEDCVELLRRSTCAKHVAHIPRSEAPG